MSSRLCPFCMRMSEGDNCPHCGKNTNYIGSQAHLPAGYVVSGKHPYVLGAALGQGGFGITYIALDMVTNERVAIKEYFPTYCSGRTHEHTVSAYPNQEEVYAKGRDRFLDEARTLKSLSDLKNIVNVLDFFEANYTAYLVMEFLDGSSLKDYALQNGRFPARKFLEQITPLMEDLERMHQRGVVHRDIAPDNIILLPDGQMKLIDFGAARSYVGDKSMTVVVKKGFAPVEQYLSKGTTASTDVYALAATIYYCITGTVPMDSAERQYENVTLPSPSSFGADLLPNQEKALEEAMKIQQKERTQSVQEFLDNLKPKQPPKPAPVKKEKTTRSKKKPAGKKIAAILVILGLILMGQNMMGNPWKRNVLMADDTWYEDHNAFWGERAGASNEDKVNYFSKRTVFNTDIPRNKIKNVFFLDSVSSAPKKVYDVSARQNGTVLAWTEENGKDTFDLYIAGEGGINGKKACHALFYYYTKLETVHFDGNFFTDGAQSMYGMFENCVNLKSLDLSGFNTSKVTDMSNMFMGTANITSLDLGSFDTSSVTKMRQMFEGCVKLKSLNVSDFDTSQVTDMAYMFQWCESLPTLDLSSFVTTNVTDMGCMFQNCESLKSLDLGSFDTGNVINMESMFKSCVNLSSLDLHAFNTSNVTDMHEMFNLCERLTSLDLGSFDTTNVTDMSSMFNNCMNLTSLELRSFRTSNVTDMSYMFGGCKNLKSLNVKGFDTSNVVNMKAMFLNCVNLSSLDLRAFNTSNVTEMQYMFSSCEKLTYLDLNSFRTSNVTDMSYMFGGCKNLKSLNLSGFNSSNVTDMSYMFSKCEQLVSLNIRGWDTPNVVNMKAMFENCVNLASLNLRTFNTSNVTDMQFIFGGCKQLTSLDLSSFDTANVTNMGNMFCSCENLTSLDLSSFNTSNVINMSYMFYDCKKLPSLDLKHFDISKVTAYDNFRNPGKLVNGRAWKEWFRSSNK